MTESQYDEIRGAIRALRGEVLKVDARLDEIEKRLVENDLDRGGKHAVILGYLKAIRAQTKTMGIDPLPLHLTEEQARAQVSKLSWIDPDGNPVPGPCADYDMQDGARKFVDQVNRHARGQGGDRALPSNEEAH